MKKLISALRMAACMTCLAILPASLIDSASAAPSEARLQQSAHAVRGVVSDASGPVPGRIWGIPNWNREKDGLGTSSTSGSSLSR